MNKYTFTEKFVKLMNYISYHILKFRDLSVKTDSFFIYEAILIFK